MPDLPANILSLLNIIFAFGVFAIGLIDARHAPPNVRWLKIMQAAIGLYWAALYICILGGWAAGFDNVQFGRLFVRPAFTLTLGLTFSAVLFRARRNNK